MTFAFWLKSFTRDDTGAVTVDWVVLTAAIVGIGVAVLSTISTGVDDLSTDVSSQLTVSQIRTTFD